MNEIATTAAPHAALGLEPESARPHVPEAPVFAAVGEARPKALRLIARTVALLVGLWLLAFVAGLLGMGTLPGLPLVGDGPSHRAPQPAAARHEPVAAGLAAAASDHGAIATIRRAANDAVSHRTSSRSHRTASRPTRRAPQAPSSNTNSGSVTVAPQATTSPSLQSNSSASPRRTGQSRSSSTHGTGSRPTSSNGTTHRSTPPQSQAGTAPGHTGTAPSKSPQATEHAAHPLQR